MDKQKKDNLVKEILASHQAGVKLIERELIEDMRVLRQDVRNRKMAEIRQNIKSHE